MAPGKEANSYYADVTLLSEERAVSLPPGARYPDRMEALTPLAYDWRDAAADRELRKARLTGLPTPPPSAPSRVATEAA